MNKTVELTNRFLREIQSDDIFKDNNCYYNNASAKEIVKKIIGYDFEKKVGWDGKVKSVNECSFVIASSEHNDEEITTFIVTKNFYDEKRRVMNKNLQFV